MANPKNDDARHIIENETSGGWYEQLSRNQLVRCSKSVIASASLASSGNGTSWKVIKRSREN